MRALFPINNEDRRLNLNYRQVRIKLCVAKRTLFDRRFLLALERRPERWVVWCREYGDLVAATRSAANRKAPHMRWLSVSSRTVRMMWWLISLNGLVPL